MRLSSPFGNRVNVCIGPSSETHEHTSLSISTTFGEGFSVSGETWLHGVDPHQVEIVESGWAQKWQKRCYGR